MTAHIPLLVSVVISFFNEENFLKEAIESVISQSYFNWELILVDDGSVDNSSMIAKGYATQYPEKIFYFEHENHANRGLSFSRNYGVAKAKGKLVAILDADDIWLADKLKLQVQLMGMFPKAAMLCEASEYWHYPWHLNSECNEVIQIGKERDRLFDPLELSQKLYPLSNGAAPCPSGIIIKRQVLLKHGGFESQFTGIYQSYEDQAFLQKIYLNEFVYISSQCNNRYRQRTGSLVAKMKDKNEYFIVRNYFLKWLTNYLIVNNIKDTIINNLLKKALEPSKHPYKIFLHKLIQQLKK